LSKVINATCANNEVTAQGQKVLTATILSQGKKSSSGILILDQDKQTYVTSNASDVKDLITSLEGLIDQISIILTGLDAVTVSPGSQAASITQLGVLKNQLALTKDNLK
jgi:hypothetical protein